MSAEADWLLALSRGDAHVSAPSLDWARVGELARRHEVAALCSWNLLREDADMHAVQAAVPADLKAELRHAYLHHLLRNEKLLYDVAALDTRLEALAVPRAYLKGIWMAFEAYPDPGMRPVGDIDLLVDEHDYSAAVEALEGCGYRAYDVPANPEEALRRAQYGRQLRFTARGRRPVELHFRLVNVGPPSEREDWVWNSLRLCSTDEGAFPVPGPEAMLLHLLIHANQHGFTILRLLHDLRWALASDGPQLATEPLVEQIERLRGRTSAYFGLRLAARVAGAPHTEPLRARLRPAAVRRARFRAVWRVGAAERLAASRRRMEVESPLFYALELGTLADKRRYVSGLIAEAGGLAPFARQVVRLLGRGSPVDNVST